MGFYPPDALVQEAAKRGKRGRVLAQGKNVKRRGAGTAAVGDKTGGRRGRGSRGQPARQDRAWGVTSPRWVELDAGRGDSGRAQARAALLSEHLGTSPGRSGAGSRGAPSGSHGSGAPPPATGLVPAGSRGRSSIGPSEPRRGTQAPAPLGGGRSGGSASANPNRRWAQFGAWQTSKRGPPPRPLAAARAHGKKRHRSATTRTGRFFLFLL